MSDARIISSFAALLGALALWLMLPRGLRRGRALGMVLGVAAAGLGGSQLPLLGQWTADALFFVLAAVTVVAAVGAVTCRNPVHCAVWFGLAFLGTAGLLLFAGAEFLAVATVVVYAGAILVTFLFVLMLAQSDGRAPYDRTSWESLTSAVVGMVLVGALSMAVGGALSRPGSPAPPDAAALAANVLAPRHVARFGVELFARHWIALQAAGCLLLAALVGAAVIVGKKGIRD